MPGHPLKSILLEGSKFNIEIVVITRHVYILSCYARRDSHDIPCHMSKFENPKRVDLCAAP